MPSPVTHADPKKTSESYTNIDPIRDPDGLIAHITVRDRDGRVSFSITREYEQGGKTVETKFMNKRHIAGIVRLLNDLSEQLDELEDRHRSKRRDRGDK